MDKNFYFKTSCRMCARIKIQKIMELTPTPPGNNFLNEDQIGDPEPVYPLELYLCQDCGHIQLGHVVDPKILYQNNYSYLSGTSAYFVAHLKDYASNMIKQFDLTPKTLVSDIGSNDGTCLQFFQNRGMKVLGVDPATKIAQLATQNGVETVADFFSYDLAKRLRQEHGPAGFITSHNACAHIDNLDDVVRGVEHWLDDNGIFVLEVGYFLDVFSNIWFDTIYHEHVDYHTVEPFIHLFDRFGMEVIQVERVAPQGGSIRVMVQKKGGRYDKDGSIDELIALEHQAGLREIKTYTDFANRILNVRDSLLDTLRELKNKGKSIAAYGAPTKATTLMTHFKLGKELIDFIVDDNLLKQNLYSPLSHIPILSSDMIYKKKPDYLLILAWNFADPIMKIHKKYGSEIGTFIVPMPELRLINQ
jgi:SAM-dependent methyltransferase